MLILQRIYRTFSNIIRSESHILSKKIKKMILKSITFFFFALRKKSIFPHNSIFLKKFKSCAKKKSLFWAFSLWKTLQKQIQPTIPAATVPVWSFTGWPGNRQENTGKMRKPGCWIKIKIPKIIHFHKYYFQLSVRNGTIGKPAALYIFTPSGKERNA